MEPAVAVDHGVSAELSGVLAGSMEPSPFADQSGVRREGAWRPDLPQCAATGAEQPVEDPVYVCDDGERDVEVVPVGAEPRRVVGEGDDDRLGVVELVEVIAHGDHMLLARQSSKVTVQHQQQRTTSMVTEPERDAVMVDEVDIGDQIAHADDVPGGHVRFRRASSMPRWKVGDA